MNYNQKIGVFIVGSHLRSEIIEACNGLEVLCVDTDASIGDELGNAKCIILHLNGSLPDKSIPNGLFDGSSAGAAKKEAHPLNSIRTNASLKRSIEEFAKTFEVLFAIFSCGGGSANGSIPEVVPLINELPMKKIYIENINPSVSPEKMVKRLRDLLEYKLTNSSHYLFGRDEDTINFLVEHKDLKLLTRFEGIKINTIINEGRSEKNTELTQYFLQKYSVSDIFSGFMGYVKSCRQRLYENGTANSSQAINNNRNQLKRRLDDLYALKKTDISVDITLKKFTNPEYVKKVLKVSVENNLSNYESILSESRKSIIDQVIKIGLTKCTDVLSEFRNECVKLIKEYSDSTNGENFAELVNAVTKKRGFLNLFSSNLNHLSVSKLKSYLSLKLEMNKLKLLVKIIDSIYSEYSDENIIVDHDYEVLEQDEEFNVFIRKAMPLQDLELNQEIEKNTTKLIESKFKCVLRRDLNFSFDTLDQNVLDSRIVIIETPKAGEVICNVLKSILHVKPENIKVIHNANADEIKLHFYMTTMNYTQLPKIYDLLKLDERKNKEDVNVQIYRTREFKDTFPVYYCRDSEEKEITLIRSILFAFFAHKNLLSTYKECKTKRKFKNARIELNLPNKKLIISKSMDRKYKCQLSEPLLFDDNILINKLFWESFAEDRLAKIAEINKTIEDAGNKQAHQERITIINKVFTKAKVDSMLDEIYRMTLANNELCLPAKEVIFDESDY